MPFASGHRDVQFIVADTVPGALKERIPFSGDPSRAATILGPVAQPMQ